MNYSILEKEFLSPNSIYSKYFMVDSDENKIDVLIVSFFGNYPHGSLGKNHAKFISRKIISGLIEFDPDAMIIDFRELEYNWGNNILDVFEHISLLKDAENTENEAKFPVFVLVSEKSKNGLLSLVTPTNSKEIPFWIVEDRDKAIKKAIIKGNNWLHN